MAAHRGGGGRVGKYPNYSCIFVCKTSLSCGLFSEASKLQFNKKAKSEMQIVGNRQSNLHVICFNADILADCKILYQGRYRWLASH